MTENNDQIKPNLERAKSVMKVGPVTLTNVGEGPWQSVINSDFGWMMTRLSLALEQRYITHQSVAGFFRGIHLSVVANDVRHKLKAAGFSDKELATLGRFWAQQDA